MSQREGLCPHPKSRRRIERVSMPEGVYRSEHCRRCRCELSAEFLPSKLTRAVMAAVGATDPDDFGIAYRDKRGWSPVGLAMRIAEEMAR